MPDAARGPPEDRVDVAARNARTSDAASAPATKRLDFLGWTRGDSSESIFCLRSTRA